MKFFFMSLRLSLLGWLSLILGIFLIAWDFTREKEGTLVNASRERQSNLPDANSELCQLKPGSVYDGDTIRMYCRDGEHRVRFCGIDAPEMDQPGGVESRDHLRKLIALGGGDLYVIRAESDRYGRTIAELFVPTPNGDIHLNSQMIADGHAWNWTQYSQRCPNAAAYTAAENVARQRGLYPPPGKPPWEWRRGAR